MSGLVICMRAVPGSGKSTFAKKIKRKYEEEGKSVEIVSADTFFEELGGGSYKFDPTKLKDAHNQCFNKFIKALKNNIDVVIVDNTNLAPWEMTKYREAADNYSYDFVVKQVEVDIEEASKRNVHGVPADRYPIMADKMKQPLPEGWRHERYRSETVDGNPEFTEISDEVKKAMRKNRMQKFSKIMSDL